jgi:site-specific DNA-cytosine methylase
MLEGCERCLQHNTTQHNTTTTQQHNKHKTTQHNTTQHNTTHADLCFRLIPRKCARLSGAPRRKAQHEQALDHGVEVHGTHVDQVAAVPALGLSGL